MKIFSYFYNDCSYHNDFSYQKKCYYFHFINNLIFIINIIIISNSSCCCSSTILFILTIGKQQYSVNAVVDKNILYFSYSSSSSTSKSNIKSNKRYRKLVITVIISYLLRVVLIVMKPFRWDNINKTEAKIPSSLHRDGKLPCFSYSSSSSDTNTHTLRHSASSVHRST